METRPSHLDATNAERGILKLRGAVPADGVRRNKRRNVSLNAGAIEVLTKVGGGVLSLGIREAARRLKQHGDTRPFSPSRHASRGLTRKDYRLNGPDTVDGCRLNPRTQVTFDEETAVVMLRIGGGDLSLGIREAARRLGELEDAQAFVPRAKAA